MAILRFFRVLWDILVQFCSIFSLGELLLFVVWGALVAYFLWHFSEWAINPDKYKKRGNH